MTNAAGSTVTNDANQQDLQRALSKAAGLPRCSWEGTDAPQEIHFVSQEGKPPLNVLKPHAHLD